MDAMSLPSLFKGQEKDTSLFLSIFVTNSTVRAVLWRVTASAPKVLEISTTHTYTDQKSLLVATDQALQELGPDSEKTDQVVFVLENNWIKDGGILEDKKPILKKLAGELSLRPMGFVISCESIVSHLVKENPQISALVVGLTRTQMTLTLIGAGKKVAAQSVGKSGDTTADLNEALARLAQQQPEAKVTYPGKILVYSVDLTENEIQKEQQELLKKPWHESHSFMQPPVIDLIKPVEAIEQIVQRSAKAVAKPLEPDQNQPVQKSSLALSSSHSPFGFKEVAVDPSVMVKQPPFAVANKRHHHPTHMTESHRETALTPNRSKWNKLLRFFNRHTKFVAVGFASGLVTAMLIFWLILPKMATVEIILTLKQETIARDAVITLSSAVETADPQKLLLPATTVDKEVTGSRSADSTGVKLVGDSATGQVELYNKTDNDKIFPVGTQLTIKDQKFTLEEEAKVVAAKTEENTDGSGQTKVYGKATVKAKAAEIGEDSNLGSGQDGQVESYDTNQFSVSTTSAFSGGTSREVKVVSKQDRTSLLEELKTELTKIAGQEFASESSDGTYLIPTGVTEITNYQFDAEVGDEINSLKLDMTLQVEAYSYHSQDLSPLAKEVLAQDLPSGYNFDEDSFQILSSVKSDAKTPVGQVLLEANLSATVVPQVSLDELTNQVAGLSISDAQAQLENQDNIETAQIRVSPSLLQGLVKALPAQAERIKIQVAQ